MRLSSFFLLIGSLSVLAPSSHAYVFSDDFESYGAGTGISSEWTPKIGTWSVLNDGANNSIRNTSGNVYGVLWKNDSLGVFQSIQVDAYFDPSSSSNSSRIAHLRLRTSDNSSGVQPYWDTGYLGEFRPEGLRLYDASPNSGTTLIANWDFQAGSSPIDSTGWYTLGFSVAGIGAGTHLSMSVNGTDYIDTGYAATAALDSGYIGLGRLARYDNAMGSSSMTPVPEPPAVLLLVSGLFGLAGFRRKTNTGVETRTSRT